MHIGWIVICQFSGSVRDLKLVYFTWNNTRKNTSKCSQILSCSFFLQTEVLKVFLSKHPVYAFVTGLTFNIEGSISKGMLQELDYLYTGSDE